MKNYREQILNRLLDKYESSKSFIGANSVNQSFKIELSKVFPEYADDSHVKEIQQVNEAVNELDKDRFVSSVYRRNGLLYAVKLNTDRLDDCYAKLKRRPKKDTNEQLLAILDKYCKGSDVVNTFARTQIERIRNNKKVEHFKGDINEYESLLKILSEVTRVDKETFIRDFSIRVLGDSKAFEKIKSTVLSFPDVRGAYDLVLNNYGPDAYNGSIHIEVPDTYSASDLDELIRTITVKVYAECNVILTAIGVYSFNTKDDESARIEQDIREIVLAHEYALQMHGFYINDNKKTIRFDVVISFDAKDRQTVYKDIAKEVAEKYPGYELQIVLDTDFSES